MKFCKKCSTNKAISDFNKNSGRRDGLNQWCTVCYKTYLSEYYKKNKEKMNADSNKYYAENKGAYKKWFKQYYTINRDLYWQRNLRFKFNLTLDAWNFIISIQDGECPCGVQLLRDFKQDIFYRPVVDHSHACCSGNKSCGKCIRGILCWRCNSILGAAKENYRYLPKFLIDYLKMAKEREYTLEIL